MPSAKTFRIFLCENRSLDQVSGGLGGLRGFEDSGVGGFGFGVWGLESRRFIVDRVWGAGFRVSGLGAYDFGVWGDGLQARKGESRVRDQD